MYNQPTVQRSKHSFNLIWKSRFKESISGEWSVALESNFRWLLSKTSSQLQSDSEGRCWNSECDTVLGVCIVASSQESKRRHDRHVIEQRAYLDQHLNGNEGIG